MRCLLFLAAAAWLLVAADASCFGGSDEDKDWKAFTCTRLPLTVRPTKYDVQLKFPSTDSDTYEGRVDIAIEFPLLKRKKHSLAELSAKPEFSELIRGFSCQKELCEINYILMHAGDNIEIKELHVLRESRLGSLIHPDGKKERKVSKVLRDKTSGQLAIKLAHGCLSTEDNVISIAFKGKMRKDMRGIYVSTYNDGQNVYKHIVSQFQPTDARTAFPCFDEPRFRANFTLTITHGSKLTAHGNTEVAESKSVAAGLTSTRFVTTPQMPIHMVAFVIGQFDELETTIKGVKVRVLTAPGKRESGHFALQVATDSLAYFEKYINFKFPLTKLDVVAIADHDKDNTESWGLVFVRDTLLWIDEETKPDTKITTAVNVAHVVVHQWFGNLISAAWWSELWITEGVAAQFAFKIVQELYPFQSEYFVRIATLSGIMQTDQSKSHALSPPIEELQTSEQIYGIFDNLEFMKSGSMAEMVSGVIPEEGYREGLQNLIARRAYKTVTKDDYLNAITADGPRQDFPNTVGIVETFIKFKGVPLLNVMAVDEGRESIYVNIAPYGASSRPTASEAKKSQDLRLVIEFLYGDGATGKQDIPHLEMRAKKGEHYAEAFPRPDWFDEQKSETVYCKMSPKPSIATYFRTRYNDQLFDRLILAVQHKWISPMDRLQLLDDSNQLTLAGLIPANTFGKLVKAYAQEDDSAVLIELLIASKTLSSLKQTEALASIQPALMRVFETHGFKVTGDEDFLLQRVRSLALKAFITQGNQQVIDAALKAYEDANGEVALFLREPVYTAIAVSGSSQIESLLAKLAKTKSYEEQIRLVSALSLSKDKQVLQKTLDWISSSGLKAGTVKPYVEAISASLKQ